MAEVRNTPPPLPNIPRPNTLLPRAKVSQQNSMNDEPFFGSHHAPSVRSNGSNGSSDSGSFQSHVTTPKTSRSMSVPSEPDHDVTNLRQLMRRQSDLAFKSLDTGPSFRPNLEAHHESSRGFPRENSAPSGFATTARAYHDPASAPKRHDGPPPPPSTHTLGGLTRRKSIDAPGPEFATSQRQNAEPFILPSFVSALFISYVSLQHFLLQLAKHIYTMQSQCQSTVTKTFSALGHA
jgi:hypothetical protein